MSSPANHHLGFAPLCYEELNGDSMDTKCMNKLTYFIDIKQQTFCIICHNKCSHINQIQVKII